MVAVKHRSPYDSSFNVHDNTKSTLPYGNSVLNKSSSCGFISSKRDLSNIPVFGSQGRQNKTSRLGSSLTTLVKGTVLVVLGYYIFSLYNELTVRDTILKDIRQEFDTIEDALLQNDAKIDSTRKRMKSLQSQFGNLLPAEIRKQIVDGEDLNNGVIYEKVVERQGVIVNRINDLQNNIAQLNRWEAEEHFGFKSHKVEFNIRVDSDLFRFVVELASLDLMPHSVNYFMQMVKNNVWNGAVFGHQSAHILYAELIDIDGNDKSHIIAEKNLSPNLSFPEYTNKYPHHKYTLGFTGRPGGPGFYINTDDNSQTHGPGGQTEHALHEEADPCFGIVVEGHTVIDWMQSRTEMALRESNSNVYTVIDSIRILE